MKFVAPFGPTQSASLDLGQSFFECCGNGFHDQPFLSGAVAPLIAASGDYNGDGAVDAADYTVWRDNLGGSFDLNGNGDETGDSADIVDAADYALWRTNFGATSAAVGEAASSAVPDPATLAMVGLLLASLVGRRYFVPAVRCKKLA